MKNDFETKLPKVLKARREQKLAEDRLKQTSIDPHLEERVPKERVIPYSDGSFRQTALEWLIETDQVRFRLTVVSSFIHHINQPIQALEHPKFKEMISVAARATHGVTIPNRKATRNYIMDLFQKNLTNLRSTLTVTICHLDIYFSLTSVSLE
jgi:hypothetical protein